MRTTLSATLICVASLVMPCAHAQQTDAARKHFLEYKAEAGRGNTKAQCDLGICYMSASISPDY